MLQFEPSFAMTMWGWLAIVLLAVLVVGSLVFWYYHRAWSQFNATSFLPPFRIHLSKARDTQWTSGPAVQSQVARLIKLDFVEAGVFDIAEIPAAKIHGFIHESTRVLAAIYHANGRVWVDLESFYEDGSSIGYSTASVGEELPRPSHLVQILLPELSLEALYHRMVQDRPRGRLKTVSRAVFAALYEANYAAFQDWLAERGGHTAAELRTLIPAGEKIGADALQSLREKVAREALINWYKCQPEMPLPADVINDCMPIIHDDLTMEQVIFAFCRTTGDWDPDEKHIPPQAKRPRAIFAALNEIRKGGLTKFCEKSTPLAADFYCCEQLEDH